MSLILNRSTYIYKQPIDPTHRSPLTAKSISSTHFISMKNKTKNKNMNKLL